MCECCTERENGEFRASRQFRSGCDSSDLQAKILGILTSNFFSAEDGFPTHKIPPVPFT